MTYLEVVEQARELMKDVDVSAIKENVAFQFNVVGEGEGIFYAALQDGVLSIEPYSYNDRDAMLIGTADLFMQMLSGKKDPVVAFTMGKLKIEGDLGKALILKSMIDSKKKADKKK